MIGDCEWCGKPAQRSDFIFALRSSWIHLACLGDIVDSARVKNRMGRPAIVRVDVPDDEDRAAICPHCGRSFDGLHGVKVHIRRMHRDAGKESVTVE